MANQKIRIKLKSYEHKLIDQSAQSVPALVSPAPSRSPRKGRSSPSFALCISTRTAANSSSAAPISG